MIILGIDPGLVKTGWGVIKYEGGSGSLAEHFSMNYVDSGVINTVNALLKVKRLSEKPNLSASDIEGQLQCKNLLQALNRMKIFENANVRDKNLGLFCVRLTYIFEELCSIISKFQPHAAAIENTYVNMNYESSLKLAHARCAAIIAVASQGVCVSEYQAKTVKKTLSGYGGIGKEHMQSLLKMYLPNLSKEKMESIKLDESDALSIAICHAYMVSNRIR